MRSGTSRPLSRRDFLKSATLGAGILATGSWLAACSPAAAPAPTQAPSQAAQPTQASAAAPTQATLDETPQAAAGGEPVVYWGSDDWFGQADKGAAYKKMIDEVSAEIGIPIDDRIVDYTTIGQQAPIIMAAEKFTADIIFQGSNEDLFNYARQGKLLALDDLISPDFWKQCLPSLLEIGSYKGKKYGVVVWSSWHIGFYNKDLYQKAGLDPEKGPTTLAEMEEHIKKLQPVCKMPYLDVWTEGGWTRVFKQVVSAKDGHWYEGGTKDDPDAIKWTFTAPECQEAVTWMKHMFQDKLLSPDSVNLTQQDVADRFGLGDVGMTFNWDGFAAIAEKPGVSKIAGKIGAFGFPGDEPGKAVAVFGPEIIMMPRTARNPKGAGKFIEAIESPKIQKERAISMYYNPLFADVYNDPEVQKRLFYWKVIQEVAPRTVVTNYHPAASEVDDYFKGKLQEAVTGQTEVDAVLADVQKLAEEKSKG